MSDNEFEKWLKNYKREEERTKDLAAVIIIVVLFAGIALYAACLSWGVMLYKP